MSFLINPYKLNVSAPFDGYFFMKIPSQSNGIERFVLTGNATTGVLPGVFTYKKDDLPLAESDFSDNGTWQPLNSGINGSTGVEPVPLAFAIDNPLGEKLYNTYGKESYFIQTAVGGTGIDISLVPTWNIALTSWDQPTQNGLYYRALWPHFKAAWAKIKKTKNLKPIFLIIHGETDANTSTTTAGNYYNNMVDIINQARIDTGFTDAPVIITSLRPDSIFPYKTTVITAQQNLALNLSRVYLHDMNTPRTTLYIDGQHYNPQISNDTGTLSAVNAGQDLADLVDTTIKPLSVAGWNDSIVYDEEAFLFFTRMWVQFTSPFKVLYNNFFTGIKSDHSATAMNQIFDYILLAPTPNLQSGMLRLESNSKISDMSQGTWAANTGITSPGYLSTGFIPSTDASVFTLNAGSFGVYLKNVISEDGYCLGVYDAVSGTYLLIQANLTGVIRIFINSSTDANISFAITGTALIHVYRYNSTNCEIFVNGISKGTFTIASSAFPTKEVFGNKLNLNGGGTNQSTATILSMFFGSATLDPVKTYNRMTTLFTGMGVLP